MSIDIHVYPSLLTLVPMLFAPLFLLFRTKVIHKILATLTVLLDLLIIYKLMIAMPMDEYTGGWILRGIHLRFDNLSLIYTLLFVTVIGTSWISSFKKNYPPLFYFLTSILLSTLNTSAITLDLFNIYVMLELSSIIAYILIAMKENWKHLWASLKYLMISYFAFTMYLTAVGLIYMHTGTLDITRISGEISPIIASMLIVPLLLKSGVFPVSMWLPAAHSLAPTEVSAILSGSFVKMGSIVIFRLTSTPILKHAYIPITFIALLSALIGVILAYNESNVKRILAFHTISQMGYVLAGGPIYGSLHAFNHGIFKSLLFFTVGDQVEETGHYDIKALKHAKFPMYRYIFLLIGILGIAGVPLFSGFISKSIIIHHMPLYGKIALILASIGTVASMAKLASIGYRKSILKIPSHYLIFATITVFVGIKYINYALSSWALIESFIVIAIGLAIFLILHPKHIPRILEKLDIMVIEYMLTLISMWAILYIQR